MTAHKTPLSIVLFGLLGSSALTAQASYLLLQNGDRLTIDAGVAVYDPQFIGPVDVISGSYFAFDLSGDSKIQAYEKFPLAMGTTGFIVGATSVPGEIDAPWGSYTYGDGPDYFTVPFAPLAAGMDMSGWTRVYDIFDFSMGTGAWTPVNCIALGCSGMTFVDGIGNLTWSGIYGDSFTLQYTATAPDYLAQVFETSRYYLHIEGVVNQATVPVPAAVWLFGSGLLGLLGVARRKRTA
jgi:hypothetical protein